jgi:outer membrane lipoprotein carrier protein
MPWRPLKRNLGIHMNFKKIFFILFFFITPIAFAEETLTPTKKLESTLSMWETLSADFTQTIVDNNDRIIHKYSGRVYLEKPNRLRWIIKSPEPQEIVSDGKNLWIYDEELAQVTIQPVSEQLTETPAMFLSGSFKQIEDGFNISLLKASENEQRFLLVPKNDDNLIARIEMTFNIDFNIKNLQILDAMQQTTSIDFTDVRDNPELSKEVFTFVAPQNVDVIGEARK